MMQKFQIRCFFNILNFSLLPNSYSFLCLPSVLAERKDSLAVNFVKQRKEKFRKMEDSVTDAKERMFQKEKKTSRISLSK